MPPRHQVLIPVYNGAEHLARTMDSVLSQDLENMEVLVSDNASEDATPDVLERYADDPRVTVSRTSENVGMFGNWARLLAMVDADSYTLISHDDLFSDETALSQAMTALMFEPDCPAVFSDIRYIDGDDTPTGLRRFARSGAFDARAWARRSILSCRNQLGQPLAIRTEAARNIGFDERLRYAGDLGFAARLAVSQGRPVHIPKPLFLYRMHSASGTLKLQRHALADMRLIAEDLDIELSTADRIRQRCAFHATTLARSAVLRLSSWRAARRRPPQT